MEVRNLRWVGVRTRHYEAMVSFLRDVLGLRVSFEEPTTVELSTSVPRTATSTSWPAAGRPDGAQPTRRGLSAPSSSGWWVASHSAARRRPACHRISP